MVRVTVLAAIAILAAGDMACEVAAVATATAPAADNMFESYPLGPGDKVRISVFGVPEITGEYAISPVGAITLPLLGDLKATGVTTTVLLDDIRRKLAAGYVKNPLVTVEVISYRPFYVLGEVNKPGEYPFAANETIEQAVAAAGGYTYRAGRRRAFLRRAGGPEQKVEFHNTPVYVMPGDTIRIGERYL